MTQPTSPTTPASLSQPKQDLLRALLKNRDKASGRHEVSNIVPFKKGAPGGRSLFFFPATDGGVSYFRHVAPYLPDDLAFYGCQAPGFDEECAPLRTVEEIAEYNLRTVRAIQPKGPYYLGGFCMGGLPSYELACRLEAAGEEVTLVQLMPVFLRPWACLPGSDELQLRAIEDHHFIFERIIGIKVALPMDEFRAVPHAERYEYVTRFMRDQGHLKGPAEEHLFMHRMKMYEAGLSAMLGYRPSAIFGGPFDVVVIGNDHRGEIELDMNTSYTVHLRALPPGRARYHRLDADSASMLSGHEPDCGTIGRRLASFFA